MRNKPPGSKEPVDPHLKRRLCCENGLKKRDRLLEQMESVCFWGETRWDEVLFFFVWAQTSVAKDLGHEFLLGRWFQVSNIIM